MRANLKYCLVVLLLWSLNPTGTEAQLPIQDKSYAQQLSIKDGLLSAVIYYLHQDKKGYIWIATDKGVARYNGLNFEYFTTENGLRDNEILQIYEDYKGRVWFIPFQGGLSYFEKDSLYQHPLNPQIEAIIEKDWISSIYVDKGDTLWFTLSNRRRSVAEYNFFRVYQNTIDTFYPAQDPNSLYIPNKNFIKYWTKPLGVINSGKLGTGRLIYPTEKKIEAAIVESPLPRICKKCILRPDTSLFCMNNGGSFLIKNKQFIEYHDPLPKDKFRLASIYDDTNIVVGTNNGVWFPQSQQKILKPYTINHCIQDREGNLWVGSNGQGVFIIKNTNIQHWELSKTISSILPTDSLIWLGTKDGTLYYYSSDKGIQKFDYGEKGGSIPDLFQLPDGDILLPSFYQIDQNLNSKYKKKTHKPLVKAISQRNEEEILLGAGNGLYTYYWKEDSLQQIPDFAAWVNDIYRVSADSFWLATDNGLFFYDGQKVWNKGDLYPPLQKSITSVVYLNQQLLAATQGKGIWILDADTLKTINIADGLSSNFINVLYGQKDTLWIGSNKGLDRLVFQDAEIAIQQFIDDVDIQSLAIDKQYLWLGSSDGVLRVNTLQTSAQDYRPPIYLHAVTINNQKQPLQSTYDLAYYQNNIIIDFVGIAFRHKVGYRYKLEGVDEQWQYTKNPKVQYPKLPPGDYTFLATAATINNPWNPEPIKIQFRIVPHFTQTIYFLILLWILGIGAVLLIATIIVRTNNRKNRVIRRISELENKALRSQMNPHFIFNVMNSILYLVNTSQKKRARRYITKFSKLMRRILEQSQYTLIDLNEEIETIELYLSLEELRYDGQISSTISIEPKLDLHQYQIPSMLLQPLVENALIHGLSPKKSLGELHIALKKVLDDIEITITDNGIGRKAAAHLGYSAEQVKKTSTGLNNIIERIEQINTIYHSNISLKIIDLYNEQEAIGTQIIIKLPKL
ncbi:MAG: hypothetical protein GY810_04645 [Aureispira sp.]|nr:hypothetical protein [Aureispira sp.]